MNQSQNGMANAILYIPFHCGAHHSICLHPKGIRSAITTQDKKSKGLEALSLRLRLRLRPMLRIRCMIWEGAICRIRLL